MTLRIYNYLFFIIVLFCLSCNEVQQDKQTLFQLMNDTGINFENKVNDSSDDNCFLYRNFYNGGGVAIGDINNDGLADVMFTSNMSDNKLYLNKGNFKFEDVTAKAGVAGISDWSSGVTMADVNADGWLDIYVCAVTGKCGLTGHNELYKIGRAHV